MIFSGGVRTPLQFALGQSVSAAFSVSFVCSCCKHVCNFCNLWCNSSVRTCPVKKGISSVSSVSSKYNVSVNVSKILIL